MADYFDEDDDGFETLLALDGQTFFLDSGYWVKFEVRRVTPTKYIPQGVAYSLTLHDKNNTRVVGYDNAHQYKPKRNKYNARVTTWDHFHDKNKVKHYEFETAAQLITDFWETVEQFV